MEEKINFYSSIVDERTGRKLYGAAALNYRIYIAGGMNKLAFELVYTGMKMGYANAVAQNKQFKREF